MGKYIDAEKLIAEIERLSATEYGGNTLGDDVAKSALDYVLEEIVPSLQQEQPEVDLEKEIEEHVEDMPMSEFTHESEVDAYWDWARKEFRYFLELGLNARCLALEAKKKKCTKLNS